MEKFTQAPVGLDIDQTVSSNSTAITNLQSDVATHSVSSVSEFIALFTETDKVMHVRIPSSISSSFIDEANRNAMLTAWLNSGWIYYFAEDFEGLFGSGYMNVSNQQKTYRRLATTTISESSPTPEHSSVESITIRKVSEVAQLKVNTKSSTNISTGTRLGIIPSGYRPNISLFGQVFAYSTGKPINGSVWIDGNGNVTYYGDTISVQSVMFMTYIVGQ